MARTKQRSGDWISVLEANYSLEGDDKAWLAGLVDCIAVEHWRDRISAAFTFDLNASGVEVGDIWVHGPSTVYDKVRESMAQASRAGIDKAFRAGQVVGTISERVLDHMPDQEAWFRRTNAGVAPDILGVVAHSGDGHGLVLNLVLDAPRRSTPTERRCWTCCAAHIGAGLRLRALAPQLASLDAAPIEAIFDGDGKLHDAREGATGATAREQLRGAVRRIDKARSARGREDPDAALTAWEGLVRGRWSLVDRFDSDQRRFVVAVRNDPRFPDPRGLSLRERQVAEFAGLGRSSKEIAYVLGVSVASVDNSLRRVQAKLGLNFRVELVAFFAPQGVRANLVRTTLAGDSLLIGSTQRLDEAKLGLLTEAERGVLGLLIAGSTNRDIAARRSASPNTIANQVQSIFRKFEARSRSELLAQLIEA